MNDKKIWKAVARKDKFFLCYENKNKKQKTQSMVHHVSLMSVAVYTGILKYSHRIYHIKFTVLYS